MTKHNKAKLKHQQRRWSRIEVGRPECDDGKLRCPACDGLGEIDWKPCIECKDKPEWQERTKQSW